MNENNSTILVELRKLEKSKEALKIEKMNLEAIFESSPIGMIIIDDSTNIIMANAAIVELAGVDESEIMQHRPGNALRCIHSSKDPRGCGYAKDCKLCELRNGVEALIKDGGFIRGAELEVNLMRNEKEEKVWLRVGVEPLLINNQKHWCVALDNITERKKIEKKYKNSQKLLSETAQIGNVGGWEFNIDTLEQNWTEETYCIHEIDFNEKLSVEKGINFYTLESKPIIDEAVRRIIEFGEPFDLELDIITAKGNHKSVNAIGKADLANRRIYGFFQDITERKKSEEALSESQVLLSNAFNDSPLLMSISDLHTGKYLEVNDCFCRISGFTREEIIGKTSVETGWVNKEERKKMVDEIQKNGTVKMQIPLNCKNGKKIICNYSGNIIQTKSGKKIFSTAEDITEQKLIEQTQEFMLVCGHPGSGEEFFESLAKFLSQILNMEYVCIDRLEGDGLTAKTLAIYNHGIYETNVSYALKETPCGDVVGKTICCFPKNVCDLFPDDKALQDLNAESYIGTTLWSFDGKPIGLIAVIGQKPLINTEHAEIVLRQVAIRAAGELERKHSEFELIKKQEFLKATGEMAKVGGWEIDVEKQCLNWTEEVYRIHETSEGFQPSIENSIDFYISEYKPIIKTAVQRAIDFGEAFDFQLQIITAKGNLKWVHAKGNAVKVNGEITKVTGTFQDIHERKLIELQLKQKTDEVEVQNEEYKQINEEYKQINEELYKAKHRAEESDKLKSAFLANMSHEIRTPMNGIVGFADLLNRPDLSPQKRKDFTQIIIERSNQLLSIVNDILDISKIEAGMVVINNENIPINVLMLELWTYYSSITSNKKILFEKKCGFEDIDKLVFADNYKIKQVLNNLINNAIKFTQKGKIVFGYELKDNMLEFFVEDTGIGIPDEFIGKVFERFIQVETELSKNQGGTGLGLSISKELVNLMGGYLWIESKLNVGTKVFFTIPYIPVLEKPYLISESSNIKSQKNIENKEILIVDDDETNLLFLKELTDNLSLNVFEATNGLEAVEMYKNNSKITLVLMDMKMPIMDGIEATKLIKSINSNVKIVAQTAYALPSEKESFIQEGCDDYISKPINKDDLITLINKYI